MAVGQQQQPSSVVTTDAKVENTTNPILTNSPPMAVLPLNSSAKLDQEPNPFEQSFSGVQIKEKKESKLTLPPVASITSPNVMPVDNTNNNPIIGGGILPKEVTNQFTWDSLRTGPLSPSMLQGPANPDEYYSMKPKMQQQQQQQYRTFNQVLTQQERKRSNSQHSDDNYSLDSSESVEKKTRRRSSNKEDETSPVKKTRSRSSTTNKNIEDDEKRKNFLERNRIAALKCRQRKKQWLSNLQAKVEFLTNDNERLQLQSESLKEEIVNLKTLLLAHKECPVAQANGFHVNAVQKAMPSMMPTQPSVTRSVGNVVPPYINGRTSLPPSIPQFQSSQTSIVPTPPQQPTSQSMVAGGARGSSGVLRF
ncbi:hypothetical protein G6F43_006418 [Rhizopus delemar]|nr:hypothetical protein G6F43_006418 [Rhizopus delemar]